MFQDSSNYTYFTLQQATVSPLWVVVRIDTNGQETVVTKPLEYRVAMGEKQHLEVKWVTGGSDK